MKKTEKILIALAIVGQIMRILYWDGASIISVAAGAMLAIFYLATGAFFFNDAGFRNAYTKFRRILLTASVGVVMFFNVAGILFKLQIFPGANILLSLASPMSGVLLAVLFSCHRYNSWRQFPVKRLIVFGSISLILWIVPYSPLVDIYYHKNPEYAEALKKAIESGDHDIPISDMENER